MSADRHLPVMLDEVMATLAPVPGGVYVDGTFGAGGYTRAILATGASVIAIDRDPSAIAAGAPLVAASEGRLTLVEGRFSELDLIAAAHGRERVDGVVLDVGVSSMQLDDAHRGFSFRFEGPLDMRMGDTGPTAAEIVNGLEPRDLARVIAVLGEEKKARSVAAAIGRARAAGPIESTTALAEIVARAVGHRATDKIHPATRTFQALRIFVNRELDELAAALAASERLLGEGGRLVVVAFHSLEDRIAKHFMAEAAGRGGGASRHDPAALTSRTAPRFRLVTSRALRPTEAETATNPRARSARLRALERLEEAA